MIYDLNVIFVNFMFMLMEGNVFDVGLYGFEIWVVLKIGDYIYV